MGRVNLLSSGVRNFGSEDKFQGFCARFLRGRGLNFFHVPNGLYSNRVTVSRFKHMGMSPGVPDLLILDACSGYSGLVIELKCGRNKPTAKQLSWLTIFRSCGWAVCWVNGVYEFEVLLDLYLSGAYNNDEHTDNFYFGNHLQR